jgi:hypothetical protein
MCQTFNFLQFHPRYNDFCKFYKIILKIQLFIFKKKLRCFKNFLPLEFNH